MSNNPQSEFGLSAILKNYSIRVLIQDLAWPTLISIIPSILFYRSSGIDKYLILIDILKIGLTILPVFITLILTSYAVMVAYIIPSMDFGAKYKQNPIDSINRSMAAALILSIICSAIIFGLYIFTIIGLSSSYADALNSLGFFLSIIALLLPIVLLYNIVIDLFNTGILIVEIKRRILNNRQDNSCPPENINNHENS